MLAALGFEALATTSAGHAFSIGQDDNTLTREATLAHAREIVAATDLPVSADLGSGFGDDPDAVAETIRLAGRRDSPAPVSKTRLTRTRSRSTRNRAGRRARARRVRSRGIALPMPLVLTARAENFIVGRPDLADTIKRLQAFQDAGADVPVRAGAEDDRRREDGRARGRSAAVNVLAGIAGARFTIGGFGRRGRAAREHGLRAGARGPRRVPARRHRDARDTGHSAMWTGRRVRGGGPAVIALGTTRPSPQPPRARR